MAGLAEMIFGHDTPLRLKEAAMLAFPNGGMTAGGLRREAKRGRLVIERVAGTDYAGATAVVTNVHVEPIVTKGVMRLSHFSGGLLARVERRDDRRPAPDDCSGRRRTERRNRGWAIAGNTDPKDSDGPSPHHRIDDRPSKLGPKLEKAGPRTARNR